MSRMYSLNDEAPNWVIRTWEYSLCEDYDFVNKTPIKGWRCVQRHAKRCACWCDIQKKKNPSGYGCQTGGKLDRKPIYHPATIKEVLERKAIHISEIKFGEFKNKGE